MMKEALVSVARTFLLLPVFLFTLTFSPNFTESSLQWTAILLIGFFLPAGFLLEIKRKPGVILLALALGLAGVLLTWWKSTPYLLPGVGVYLMLQVLFRKIPHLGLWLIGRAFLLGGVTFVMTYTGVNSFTWSLILRSDLVVPWIASGLLCIIPFGMIGKEFRKEEAISGLIALLLLAGFTWLQFGPTLFLGFLLTHLPVMGLVRISKPSFKGLSLGVQALLSIVYFAYQFMQVTHLNQYLFP